MKMMKRNLVKINKSRVKMKKWNLVLKIRTLSREALKIHRGKVTIWDVYYLPWLNIACKIIKTSRSFVKRQAKKCKAIRKIEKLY